MPKEEATALCQSLKDSTPTQGHFVGACEWLTTEVTGIKLRVCVGGSVCPIKKSEDHPKGLRMEIISYCVFQRFIFNYGPVCGWVLALECRCPERLEPELQMTASSPWWALGTSSVLCRSGTYLLTKLLSGYSGCS